MAKSTLKKFKDPLDSIIWEAYKNRKFFKKLVEEKDDEAKLKSALENRGFVNMPAGTIKQVQEGLSRSKVNMKLSPIELMDLLHKYTTPKKRIRSEWVQW